MYSYERIIRSVIDTELSNFLLPSFCSCGMVTFTNSLWCACFRYGLVWSIDVYGVAFFLYKFPMRLFSADDVSCPTEKKI